MKIRDVMTKSLRTCRAHDSLSVPARAMWDGDCGVVPVVDETNRVIGMVTDRDVCMAAYTQGKPLADIPVRSAMSKKVVSCRTEDDLAVALRQMQAAKVHRLPVLDPQGRIDGILSLNDLARLRGERNEKAPAVTAEQLATTLAAICDPRPMVASPAKPAVAKERAAKLLSVGSPEPEC